MDENMLNSWRWSEWHEVDEGGVYLYTKQTDTRFPFLDFLKWQMMIWIWLNVNLMATFN